MNDNTQAAASVDGLPEPAAWRMRYRSEPGMIGSYPWSYLDKRLTKTDSAAHEYERLFTEAQIREALTLAAKPAQEAPLLARLRKLFPNLVEGVEVAMKREAAITAETGIPASALASAITGESEGGEVD